LEGWQRYNCTTLRGHTSRVYCVALLPKSRVISGSHDGTLKVWDMSTGAYLRTLSGHIPRSVRCVAVLPNDSILSGHILCTLKVWNVSSGECLRTMSSYNEHAGGRPVDCVAVLPDGNIVLGSGNELRVWDVSSG